MLLVGGLVLLLGACSALPESGSVHRDGSAATGSDVDSARFTAPGPGQGDAPIQIVNGFLTAMTANPAATSAARSFLSRRARARWQPAASTLVYGSAQVTPGRGSHVEAALSDPRRLDARGGWLGRAGRSAGDLDLRMVREKGEWRIDDPPDALLVPQYFLEQEYEPYELYFFDPTRTMLVPDRVYVPRGEQTASQLVRALLNGPGAALSGVTRTAFPFGTQLDLSVSIAGDGTAVVPLSRELLRLPRAALARAAAQLSWTLRQVPGVSGVRLSVDGATVPVAGHRDFEATQADRWDPAVAGAPDEVFTLARGRLSVLDPIGQRPTAPQPVSGPFGRAGYSLRSFAVALRGGTVAAVTADGRGVLRAPLRATAAPAVAGDDRRSGSGRARSTASSRSEDRSGARPAVRRVYSGTDLLPPAYDGLGDLWLVDRTAAGARVVQVSGTRQRVVDVPGVSGRTVRGFVVSRSGTGLVAIVAGRSGDSPDAVVTSQLVRDDSGDLLRATAARRDADLPSGLGRLSAIAWTSPTDLAVLAPLGADRTRVVPLTLDGSPGDAQATTPDQWPGRAVGLVGAPAGSSNLYLLTSDGRLRSLDPSGLWLATGVPKGQLAPSYAG